MAQILDLSKRYTKEVVNAKSKDASKYESIVPDGYVAKIIDVILTDDETTNKHNICLCLDIAEGNFEGYFQRLEDRAGFWGLKTWMSFSEKAIGIFNKTCQTIELNNPGYEFNPLLKATDVDTLKGKKIGIILNLEEYEKNNGDIGEKTVVVNITEIKKIKEGKFKKPVPKKLPKKNPTTEDLGWNTDIPDSLPFDTCS